MHAHAVTQRFVDVAKPEHASIFSRGSRDVLPMRLKTKAKAGVSHQHQLVPCKPGSVIRISWAPKASSMLKPGRHYQHQLALCRLMQCCKPEQASITNMGWTRAFSRNGSPLLLQHRRASSASAAPVWAHAMPCNCSNINASEHHQHQLSPCRLTRCCVTAPKPTQPSILSISCPLAGSRDALSLPSSQQASIISISCPRAGSRDALSLLRRQHSRAS